MSEFDIDVEKKRRLPSWMLGVSSASDQVRKSNRKDAIVPSSQDLQPKAMLVAKKLKKAVSSLSEKETSEVNSSSIVKCETRKRVSKSRLQDMDHVYPIPSEDGLQKKRAKKRIDGVGRTINETTRSKKRNRKSYGLSEREEMGAPSPSEENEELTVDDLMSIAEEYVKAENGEEHQPIATTVFESNKQPSTASSYCRNELGGSVETDRISGVLPTHTTTELTSSFTNTRLKDQESSASEDNPNRTGDPTQDMLDLFLGPLLKKPQTGERKNEFVREDITLECEFRKQSQSDEVLGEKVVPIKMKKKSSLKDKVAMFFD